ncbi:MAG: hypothetical protein Q9M92_13345 [Enterobacterales bacterium]|nr:hypothetical protein [Enterobacterales bacterium]
MNRGSIDIMQTFELYGTAWVVYMAFGVLLLALVGYKIRRFSWLVKFILLSFLAVGAFTPDLVKDSHTYAPLAITSLLDAEVEGVSAVISGLMRLLAVWGILVFTVLAGRHYYFSRKAQKQTELEAD